MIAPSDSPLNYEMEKTNKELAYMGAEPKGAHPSEAVQTG
jgi:hypothetical protein